MLSVKGDHLEGKRISERYRINTVYRWTEHLVYCTAEDLANFSQLVILVLVDPVIIKDLPGLKKQLNKRIKMRHKCISSVISHGDTADGELFIVIERGGGVWLNQILDNGALKVADSLNLIMQIIDGLEQQNRAGLPSMLPLPNQVIVADHKFDKSNSIRIVSTSTAKVMNLEFADSLLSPIELQEGLKNNERALYLPPEYQQRKKLDQRGQVYALGCLLYQMITGHPPFDSDDVLELESQHLCVAPKRFHQVRPDLYLDPRIEAVLLKALQKEPEKRHSSLHEFRTDLKDSSSANPVMMKRGRLAASATLLALAVYAGFQILPPHAFFAIEKKTILDCQVQVLSQEQLGLSSMLEHLPVVPEHAKKLGRLELKGHEIRELGQGDYVCESISISEDAHLFARDNVRLWVDASNPAEAAISLQDNGIIESMKDAEAFTIYDRGSANITMSGKSRIRANVLAPAALLEAGGEASIAGPFVSNGQKLAQKARFVNLSSD